MAMEDVDVLIIGVDLSGIGAAVLQGADHARELTGILPGPERSGAGIGNLRIPSALFDQYLATVETGAAVPLSGTQR